MNAASGEAELPSGYRLISFDVIDSTNERARRKGRAGEPAGLVIMAGRQESGRGRHGNVWESPEGNLYMSLLLRPDVAPPVAGQLSFVSAVAMADFLTALLPSSAHISLKWPNDILLGGKKLAGILLESDIAHDGMLEWVVIGIGLNIAQAPAGAACLKDVVAAHLSPLSVLEKMMDAFDRRYRQWIQDGFAAIREDWLARAHGVGGGIIARLPGEKIHGTFNGLDAAGALLLELPDGEVRRITAGEVFFDPAEEDA